MGSLARFISLVCLAACAGSEAPPRDRETADEPLSTTEQAVTGQDGNLTVSTANTVLNQYSALAGDAAQGGNTVTVTAIAQLDATAIGFGPLAAGDMILIYQAQGATIATADSAGYGDVTALGSAGRYELATVASVAATRSRSPRQTAVVCVAPTRSRAARRSCACPARDRSTVTGAGSVTGLPWDGTRGGIVAISVGGTAYDRRRDRCVRDRVSRRRPGQRRIAERHRVVPHHECC